MFYVKFCMCLENTRVFMWNIHYYCPTAPEIGEDYGNLLISVIITFHKQSIQHKSSCFMFAGKPGEGTILIGGSQSGKSL